MRSYPVDTGATGSTRAWTDSDTRALAGAHVPEFTEFMDRVAASSFGGGLLRWTVPGGPISTDQWNGADGWASAWPQFAKRLRVFAYDWMGRQLGFDLARSGGAAGPLIAMLDPGAGELLELPVAFADFIETEVIDEADACVASSVYADWLASGGSRPSPTECIGYKTPLFLGGEDTIENLEKSDLDVYVTVSGQVFAQAK